MGRGETASEGQSWDLKVGLFRKLGGPGGGSGVSEGHVLVMVPGAPGSTEASSECAWPVGECLGPEWPNVDMFPWQ